MAKSSIPSENRAAMTIQEACNELALSRNSLMNLIRTGDFPAIKVGKRWLISRAGLSQWLLDHCGEVVL